MAGYIAKQLVGKQLEAVKSVAKDTGSKGPTEEEVLAAMNAAEEKRREKFETQEEERESLRQTIRDKYGLKKRDFLDVTDPNSSRRPSLQRPSDASLHSPRHQPEEDQLSNIIPPVLREAASKAVEIPQRLFTEANEKCSTM
ncbi:unnamed protein product [Calicophoron daubneyi]|uniref:Complexin n=1 Tax=Calicophoron daubneyi TaxID=300641 RepID=A0AAV2T8M4_CALDB